MFAAPLIPGHSYRVKYQGTTRIVFAPNAAAAICVVLDMLEVRNA